DRPAARFAAWYEIFPRSQGTDPTRSATFREAEARLPAIAAMGFDTLYMTPIHPIGHTKRKGPNNSLVAGPNDPGSPYATGNEFGGHDAIAPELGTLQDFRHFLGAARESGLELAMDFAIQVSPDHPWVTEHPEWFHHLPDGTIRYAENPPKRYQDIHPINFWPEEEARLALWNACHEILEFWIGHGVRIFRVDNPHTKPLAFWAWLLPEVWADHPDVVFLAEAFTHPAMMHELAAIGFSQSYTYFTWRTSAYELRSYVEELAFGPHAATFRPNFWPNTPDILSGPLRNGPRAAFEIRAVLASLLAPSWGVYSGFELCENSPASPDNEEYHDSEKYRIVERDWTDPDSLAPLLRRLNEIRRAHRSVGRLDNIRFHDTEDPDVLAFSRRDGEDVLLVVVNLDPHVPHETMVRLDLGALGLADGQRFDVHDELSALVGESGDRWTWNGWHNYVRLDPAERVGHVFAVTAL
ncbi:MAG TPA: alpha-1,4-glucan--maltose-1-phosphate maltosyltransferase, partial [Microthrixaceae bacterium]|nr:alpha-1,4-glucan--maltose-1-phosphate maltosyltransferase [Microthrixaceae bacterium]